MDWKPWNGGIYMDELKQIIEQQNQRIAQLEKILGHPYFKRKLIEYDKPSFWQSPEKVDQTIIQTWDEIFTSYDLRSFRFSKN